MRTVHNPSWRLPNVDFGKIFQDAREVDAVARGRNGAKGKGMGNGDGGAIIVHLGSAGVLARNAALARGDTLILAFSHEGRRDPLAAICTWFQVAGLVAIRWIPAFAGMTGANTNFETYPCKPMKGEGIR